MQLGDILLDDLRNVAHDRVLIPRVGIGRWRPGVALDSDLDDGVEGAELNLDHPLRRPLKVSEDQSHGEFRGVQLLEGPRSRQHFRRYGTVLIVKRTEPWPKFRTAARGCCLRQ